MVGLAPTVLGLGKRRPFKALAFWPESLESCILKFGKQYDDASSKLVFRCGGYVSGSFAREEVCCRLKQSEVVFVIRSGVQYAT